MSLSQGLGRSDRIPDLISGRGYVVSVVELSKDYKDLTRRYQIVCCDFKSLTLCWSVDKVRPTWISLPRSSQR